MTTATAEKPAIRTHKVELRKPTKEENNRQYDHRKKQYVGEAFDRGERIIMVDGERWGRTVVTFHGCHGTRHVIKQDHGSIIEAEEGEPKHYENDGVCIFVGGRRMRRWQDGQEPPSTETQVQELVEKLIAQGRLIHPMDKKQQNDAAMAAYRKRVAEAEAKEEAALRARAIEALTAMRFAGLTDPQINDAIEHIMAAMKWAQTR